MKTLTTLGETVMPEVTQALKTFNYVLQAITAILKAPEWLGKEAASGVKAGYSWLFGKSTSVAPPSGESQSVVVSRSLTSQHLVGGFIQYE